MNISEAFALLKKKHGTHTAASSAIGLSPVHYRAMRNGRVNIPQRTADYIILKATELSPVPAAAPGASAHEARP